MPNKLSQFWQELKRRKVVRVITVYSAAAFVILELVDIVSPSLRLPEWTMNFIIVLLCVGFIITVIFSWVYDVTSEGIEKTKPAHKEKEGDTWDSSKSWRIASYISFVVIVGLIVFNFIPRNRELEKSIAVLPFINEELEKSIAVLPFTLLSDDPENQYLADGIMEDILLHLAKIEDLRVVSSTSVQQYRNTDKTATEICQELDVSYLLEGRFQKIGDQARLIVQLIQSGIEEHAWANDYNREWKDVFSVQSEVAQLVAKELHAVITPEEKQLIEKIPTTNMFAYEWYQKGEEADREYKMHLKNIEALDKAEDYYNHALDYDSTYAPAYNGIGNVLWYRAALVRPWSEDLLDSALILTNIALAYDHQYARAYRNRARIYREMGDYDQALIELDKAHKLNPNDHFVYAQRGYIYNRRNNLFETITNLEKAISLNPNETEGLNITTLIGAYGKAGIYERAIYYIEKNLKLNNDSSVYYINVLELKFHYWDYQSNIEFSHEVLAKDPLNRNQLEFIALTYMIEHQDDSAFVYYTKVESLDQGLWLPRWLGYTLIQNGEVAKGEKYIEEDFAALLKQLDQENVENSTYLALGEIYAYKGENEKAFEQLRALSQQDVITLYDLSFLRSPLWDNIRNEPVFRQITAELEAKYEAEHERVRQWLEENDML